MNLTNFLTKIEVSTLSQSLAPRIHNRHVIVGVSGGVDSAVSLAIIKSLNIAKSVQAAWMRNWDHQDDETGLCAVQAETDLNDAKRVCQSLNVSLHEVDLSREYWNKVWAPSLKQYAKGETPNPDVDCNREIKYGAFLEYANQISGAHDVVLATGHYARLGGTSTLLRAIDPNKDQSNFLCGIQSHALQHACFPVGDFVKSRIKELAGACGWPFLARKRESFGVCFVGERQNFSDFLDQYLPPKNAARFRLVGEPHVDLGGFSSLATGQRARISGKSKPYYIVSKEIGENPSGGGDDATVWVAPVYGPELRRKGVVVRHMNWLFPRPMSPRLPLRAMCQIRSRSSALPCWVHDDNDEQLVRIEFDELQERAAIGQIAAIYNNDGNNVCLGGGAIVGVL